MSAKLSDALPKDLLAWYDLNARALPWRSAPGSNAADPYRVWLSEVMLQQTTVAAVRPRFEAWVARWPDFASLAAAEESDVMAAWAGLGYYARARNLVKCARVVVAEHGGTFPQDEATLRTLPGLGDYTAAAIAAIAFGQRAVVVDANVKRVVARLFAITDGDIRAAADTITPALRSGDFAQAMMDLGSGICTPRAPRCLLCPVREHCAGFASGTPEAFPARKVKAAKPQRFGTIFWATRQSEVLLVRRPDRGLLGGMRALPTGPWSDTPPGLTDAPAVADWQWHEPGVTHVFTHFRLDLRLASARIDGQEVAGDWWPIDDLDSAGLPTVFLKAAAVLRRL